MPVNKLDPTPGLVLLGIAAATVLASTFMAGQGPRDFDAFYAAALAWRTHSPATPPAFLNLNPPSFVVLVSPLTFLSSRSAFLVWMVLGICAAADALRRIRYELGLSPRQTFVLACCCGALEPACTAWKEGQVTWFLMWLLTRAWIDRDRSRWRSGLWLGIVIALKPPFALMAILLRTRIWVPAAIMSLGITAASLPLTGVHLWRDWLATSGRVTWLPWPLNMSLWGVAARLQSGAAGDFRMTEFSVISVTCVTLMALALLAIVLRASNDRRWLLAGFWSLAVSPLGWTYYLPVLAGPFAAARIRRRRAFWVAVVLFSLPVAVLSMLAGASNSRLLAFSFAYAAGAACLWLAYG